MKFASLAAAVALPLALGGCAAWSELESDVSTYSTWPAQRAPGTYAFERLPSQQANAKAQARLEALARGAIEAQGFRPAATVDDADVTVQIGARAHRSDRSPWDDPLWWRGGPYSSRHGRYPYYGPYAGPFYGPGWVYRYDNARYDREVLVLIRDRRSGEPLYEARALNDGNTPGGSDLIAAMFRSALVDFPSVDVNPRRVSVTVTPVPKAKGPPVPVRVPARPGAPASAASPASAP